MLFSLNYDAPKLPNTDFLKPKPAIVQQVELTVEQKIATNYYKCNTDIQWIRADNAECLDKEPQYVQKPATAPINSSQGNSYEYGQCTYWVKQWMPSLPNNLGNANNWGYALQQMGWKVSSNPQINAIAWSTRGYYGHVALVIGIQEDGVLIREGNYDFNGSVRTVVVPVGEYQYIYQ